ncbi:MAG: DUF1592 domain-containing protein [Deltaproteobacteria bacterium]|nr:DUF1592 domain-containing protein [Deltaproteobacteria bacterium]
MRYQNFFLSIGSLLLLGAVSACGKGAVDVGNVGAGGTGPKPVADDGTRGTPLIALGERNRGGGQCAAPMVAWQPVRRLSRLEYNNAVRDLFKDDTHPGDGFVAEEKVAGFNSNSKSTLSGLAAEQYLNAALDVAERVSSTVSAVTGCASETDKTCIKGWLTSTARKAFRGTFADEEKKQLLADYDALASSDAKAALQLGVGAILTSANFLYTLESGAGSGGVVPLTSGEIAGRLALTLWRSVPDDALLVAADAGKLDNAAGVQEQARRLLQDRKADAALADFAQQWLNVERPPAGKDANSFPTFTPTLGNAMVEETRRFFLEVARNDSGSFTELLTANYTFANKEVGAFYGATGGGDDFVRTPLPASRRGVLTHASVLANAAHALQTSPVLRGKLVREQLLCDPVAPPPPGTNTNVPPVAGKSDEELFDEHSKGSCANCHRYMDPIGKGFARFDAIGAYKEGAAAMGFIEKPELTELPDDISGTFDGPVALAQKLATSKQAQQCYAVQTMRWALAREERTADACSFEEMWRAFDASGLNLREALVAVVGTPAFRFRAAAQGGQSCQ